MARRRARNEEGEFIGDNPATLEVNEAWVGPPESTPEPETKPEPAVIEPVSAKEEPVKAPPVKEKDHVETDVRKKLLRKSDEHTEDIFVPSNSAALEAEAKKVSEDKGFELNRGTSIGARLMARSKMLGKNK